MKFYILLITFCLLAIATTQLNSQQITIDLLSGSCTTQSSFSDSTLNNSCANDENINSTNQSITQNILTKPENFPWWKTDLGNVAIMDTLYIYELFGGVSITHIFFSMFPMHSHMPSELMASPVVNHIYIEETANGNFSIPLNNVKARYLTIIAEENSVLAIGSIKILGRFSTGEIPGNNIDDDLDGRIDCDDPLNIPFIRDIIIAEPSTPGASDGQIHVLTTTQNLEFSFDGGLNFRSGIYFNNILSIYTEAGEFNLVLKNDFGCLDTWIGNPLMLPERAPPPPEHNYCGNGDLNLNSFSGWSGGTRGIPLGNSTAFFEMNDIGTGGASHQIF